MNTRQTCSAARRRAGRSGTAQIEFLMVLPVFLTLVLGSLELGCLLVTRYVVMNAAEAGVRTGILPGSAQDEVRDAVGRRLKNSLTYQLRTSNVGREVPSGAETEVTIEYQTRSLTRLFSFIPRSMAYTAVMLHE